VREYDEKRDYIRMDIDCDVTYRLADSEIVHRGQCTTISGAGVSFISELHVEPGMAMEINILPAKSLTPPMSAFIEVVRSSALPDGNFEIAATIKSIKGN
jgi:hypothetical protein